MNNSEFGTVLPNSDRCALRGHGWMISELDASSETSLRGGLLSLASSFGNPVPPRNGAPVVSTLRPTASESARGHSLSARFSVGKFPYHTDTAHWPVPCRFVLLACVNPGAANRDTVLFDSAALCLTQQDRDLLYSTPFRVINGRRSFFSTVLQHGQPFIRYDQGCMAPVLGSGQRAERIFSDRDAQHGLLVPFRWKRGMVLIVDNWRVLHGRDQASCNDGERALLRVLVNGELK
jgi:alpha-ketoglutarate-dependent taurine dioxygenase